MFFCCVSAIGWLLIWLAVAAAPASANHVPDGTYVGHMWSPMVVAFFSAMEGDHELFCVSEDLVVDGVVMEIRAGQLSISSPVSMESVPVRRAHV